MINTPMRRKQSRSQPKTRAPSRNPANAKRSVGRPRSGKVSFTTTIRPDLKQYAAQIGTHATANGKLMQDVSAGIERALEYCRQHHIESSEAVDANGWPAGFFEQTAGAMPWLVRAPQGDYEIREQFE